MESRLIKMKNIIVGCDVGLRGGVAMLSESKILQTFKFPKNIDDVILLQSFFKGILTPYKEFSLVIEKPSPRPWDCKKGIFTSAFNYGTLKTILVLNGIDPIEVTPTQWTKEIFKDFPKLEGDKKKARSFRAFNKIFDIEEKHDGIVDACLIAYYYYLKIKDNI